MINYDNNDFLNDKIFCAEVVIVISIKIMQLFKICLKTKWQALKSSFMTLSFLLLTIVSNCKYYFVVNGFKSLRNLTIVTQAIL